MSPEQDALLRTHLHQVLAFTGHRPDKVQQFEQNIREDILASMMLMQPAAVVSGMAQGVDTWAAEAALVLGVPLVAAIPFKGQEKLWPASARKLYEAILARAERTFVVCEGGYHATKMQARNEWMVDHCDLLLAYWNGSAGGTANCVRHARKMKCNYFVVDPSTLLCR